MRKVRCGNGHFYNADKFSSCPFCGDLNADAVASPAPRPPVFKEPLPKTEPLFPKAELKSTVTDSFPKRVIDELAPTERLLPEEEMRLERMTVRDEKVMGVWEVAAPMEPTELEPAEEAPAEAEPVEEVPAEMETVEEASTEAERVEEVPAGMEPVEEASTEAEPVEEVPAEMEPAEEAPAEVEPVEEAPAEAKPAEEAALAEAKNGLTEETAGDVLEKTEKEPAPQSLAKAVEATASKQISALPKTVAYYSFDKAVPPVGWLVCTKGGCRGQAFECRAGRNRIGRGPDMDINLAEERTISRTTHAILIYEPRKRQFFIQAGSGDGLIYLNDNLIFSHEELRAYDKLSLGKAEFVFLPLCGERFTWDDYMIEA